MVKSMTGYGNVVLEKEGYRIDIEIKTVNHRFTEILCRTPKEINHLEIPIRNLTKKVLQRGRIEIYAKLAKVAENQKQLIVEWDLLQQYQDFIGDAVLKGFHLDFSESVAGILPQSEFIRIEESQFESSEIDELVLTAVSEALDKVSEMRIIEGTHLENVLLQHIEQFTIGKNKVLHFLPTIEAAYRERLENKLREVTDGWVDEPRLLTELAVFLDKADIHEEINRIESHLSQLQLILAKDEPIGRELDFLIQEMNREVNTIGSKSSMIEVTNAVIQMKTELEKMREQIQNIE